MNRFIPQIFVAVIILSNSCHKPELIEPEPANVRMYGFGVSENHMVFRNGDILQIIQPTEIGKWETRNINTVSTVQESQSIIDISSILSNAGINDITLIGTSKLIAYSTDRYALAILSKTVSFLELRVITLNSSFQLQDISGVVQGSYSTNSIYSAPAIFQLGNYFYVTYGIKKNSLFEVKTYEYSIDNLISTSLGTSTIPVLQVSLNEGAEMQLAGNANEFIAYCKTNPEQFFTLQRINGDIVSMLNQPLSDNGITHHYSLLSFNEHVYTSCEKTNFAGLIQLDGGNSIGMNNSYNPQLQFAHISNGELTLSIRSIPPDLSAPDFSTLRFYTSYGTLYQTIQPEEIPIRTPRYIYVSSDADGTWTLLGLTPENQAFLLKVDKDGKMISF